MDTCCQGKLAEVVEVLVNLEVVVAFDEEVHAVLLVVVEEQVLVLLDHLGLP